VPSAKLKEYKKREKCKRKRFFFSFVLAKSYLCRARNLAKILPLNKKREKLFVLSSLNRIFAHRTQNDNDMTAITINIPNHEVSFFKKMISKMGWTYSEADVVQTEATPKEQTLAKIDHAFGQLRQMKDGELEGINAEDLLNEL
jgi:hypothetical protein